MDVVEAESIEPEVAVGASGLLVESSRSVDAVLEPVLANCADALAAVASAPASMIAFKLFIVVSLIGNY